MRDFSAIYYELPLTAEEAFWHACANVPYTPRYVVPVYDACTPFHGAYFLYNRKPRQRPR